MDFKLVRAEYDRETERAYVELRARDDDGGDAITTAIFSFKTANRTGYSAQSPPPLAAGGRSHLIRGAHGGTRTSGTNSEAPIPTPRPCASKGWPMRRAFSCAGAPFCSGRSSRRLAG